MKTAEGLRALRRFAAAQFSGPASDELRKAQGEIISAGWLRLRELDVDELPGVEESKRNETRRKSYRVLADLVLKTVEIAEYHDRIAGNA